MKIESNACNVVKKICFIFAYINLCTYFLALQTPIIQRMNRHNEKNIIVCMNVKKL